MWEKLLRGYCLVTAKQWAVRARAPHHIGFRYYRLAQSTEDLYDGFRNMYLAFEVLLSSKYPKVRGEQEIEWLERGLREATETLRLRDLVPADDPDPWPRYSSECHFDTYRFSEDLDFSLPDDLPSRAIRDGLCAVAA